MQICLAYGKPVEHPDEPPSTPPTHHKEGHWAGGASPDQDPLAAAVWAESRRQGAPVDSSDEDEAVTQHMRGGREGEFGGLSDLLGF